MKEEMQEILYGELLSSIDRGYYTREEVKDILGYTPWDDSDTQPSWDAWSTWD